MPELILGELVRCARFQPRAWNSLACMHARICMRVVRLLTRFAQTADPSELGLLEASEARC